MVLVFDDGLQGLFGFGVYAALIVQTPRVRRENLKDFVLPARIAKFREQYPGITVALRIANSRAVQERVRDGEVDLAVIGGGFIGLELAENLVRLGIETSVVELQDQLLPPFDPEMTAPIAEHLREKGVSLFLGEAVRSFEITPEGLMMTLLSGKCLHSDLIILGIGVSPENGLAVDALHDGGRPVRAPQRRRGRQQLVRAHERDAPPRDRHQRARRRPAGHDDRLRRARRLDRHRLVGQPRQRLGHVR